MIQKTLRLSAIAAASFFALNAAHAAGATGNIDANIEQDNDYVQSKPNGGSSTSASTQGGRVEVNFTGKATSGDAFVAGKGTLIINKDKTGSDDMWVQFGTSAADLKLGNFEDVDMWPVGRDTPQLRVGLDPYRGQTLRGRTRDSRIHAAGTVNIAPGMSFTLGVIEQAPTPATAKGIRPTFSFSTGGISVKAGLEIGKVGGQKLTGVVATGGMSVAGGNLNVNLANAKIKNVSKDTTVGVNYTMDLGPWALLEFGQSKPDAGGTTAKVTTLGLGYQLSLLGVKGATVTPALGYTKVKNGLTTTDIRVRFNYGFDAF